MRGGSLHALGMGEKEDANKFDQQLPADGWYAVLARNMMLCELVGQIPRSGTIFVPSQTNARDDKEWHLIVHDISEQVDDHFKIVHKGERIVISGNAVPCFHNQMDLFIVPCNAIQAVLRRRDGELYAGSKYGPTAVERGCPESKQVNGQ